MTCYACEPPRPPNPLIVHFDASAATLERAGHPVDAKQAGIYISPAVAGQWFWDDDTVLRFQPAADWPIGQHYKVSLRRAKSSPPRTCSLKEYRFEFDTPAFVAKLATTEFHQDPVVAGTRKSSPTSASRIPSIRRASSGACGSKMFNRVTDKIEKELSAPTFTVIYDKLKLNAFVHSAQLEVPPKAGRLQITIEPGTHVGARRQRIAKDDSRASVDVPGLNSLKIANLRSTSCATSATSRTKCC